MIDFGQAHFDPMFSAFASACRAENGEKEDKEDDEENEKDDGEEDGQRLKHARNRRDPKIAVTWLAVRSVRFFFDFVYACYTVLLVVFDSRMVRASLTKGRRMTEKQEKRNLAARATAATVYLCVYNHTWHSSHNC